MPLGPIEEGIFCLLFAYLTFSVVRMSDLSMAFGAEVTWNAAVKLCWLLSVAGTLHVVTVWQNRHDGALRATRREEVTHRICVPQRSY
jgi:hypothetical protein